MTNQKKITEVKVVSINSVKSNPNNPRLIKDDNFRKLVASINNFPEMANVRPIIVNTDMVVLGGNMRLKAMQEAGWKEVPVQIVDWSEEQQNEFIIKDNVGFGDWDWDELANKWNDIELKEWGLNLPSFEIEDIKDVEDVKLDNYIIKYEIIFNHEGEQDKWYGFMKMLKDKYIECDTFSERLITFLEENKYV